jgi:hypothetical protein
VRTAVDLPCAGKKVELRLVTRRFVCNAPLCRRRIFAERFDEGIIAERARRTSRLECIVHHLGLALGGRPAANFAQRLRMPVQQRHPAQGGPAKSETADRAAPCHRHR